MFCPVVSREKGRGRGQGRGRGEGEEGRGRGGKEGGVTPHTTDTFGSV